MSIEDMINTPSDEAKVFDGPDFAVWCGMASQQINFDPSREDIFMNKRQFGDKIPPPDNGRRIGRAFGRDFYAVPLSGEGK